MVKNWLKTNKFTLAILTIGLTLGIGFLAYTQTSTTFLPRDEIFERVVSGENVTLYGFNCAGAGDIFQEVAQCNSCMELKENCPDCCLNYVGSDLNITRHMQCTEGIDPGNYTFPGIIFDGLACNPDPTNTTWSLADCPQISLIIDGCYEATGVDEINCTGIEPSGIDRCYSLGCPDGTYEPGVGDCQLNTSDGYWYCDADNYTPIDKGCPPLDTNTTQDAVGWSALGYNPEFHGNNTTVYYNVTDTGAGARPFQYVTNTDYEAYVANCSIAADSLEDYLGRLECCRKSATCNDDPSVCPGVAEHCDLCDPDDTDSDCACIERTEWPECDTISVNDCLQSQEAVMNCILEAQEACRACFRELQNDNEVPLVEYEFVARSGEQMAITWQMQVDTTANILPQQIKTHFYTIIRVEEKNPPSGDEDYDPIAHESIVHQKSFRGQFTIRSATHVPKEALTQGRVYVVRLYYLLPDLKDQNNNYLPGVPEGTILEATVREPHLIIARIRD